MKQRLDSLRTKTALLLKRHEMLEEAATAARQRIRELEQDNERLQKRIDLLNQENEYLRVVHSVSPSRSDAENTRALLAGLVRDIDKCIADLGE
ncbi:hypothetical protein [Paramuribaculum intestinale]|uniref:hypothetical protein n=1 Tax=Paramuribaculum intestinale TaxID=2094151 RepID=UPI000FFE7F5B|nr:hypothetical protein [Paramuribaculum intestinale]RXE63058.1 hypothetical protein ED375_02130 [Muribaculaceae bacterium Isolate-004 (NCI)]WLT42217.1 hypothetical protein NF347_01245 [Paramuribaculum intestinale]